MGYIGDGPITIADAKRGDIGNTAKQYAASIFGHFDFDSVTLSPYMGEDSIMPFLNNEEKGFLFYVGLQTHQQRLFKV